MSKEKKCKECGAYHGHAPECSLMSGEYAKSELKRYYRVWLEMEMKHRKFDKGLYKQINEAKKEVEYWKKKFVAVTKENNKLRKKVSKQK